MNQFFSFTRFSALVGKHWADNKKRYVLSILAFTGMLITWFVFLALVENEQPMAEEIQETAFLFFLFVFGTFYASQYFRDLGSNPKAINFLMVPASTFEKLLCSILYVVVLFFAVFVAIFYLVDFLMINVTKTFTAPGVPVPRMINVFKSFVMRFNADSTVNQLLFFFSIQSAFLLGSVYFRKYSFIKTIISGSIVFLILFCLLYFFYNHLLPDGEFPRGFFTSFLVRVDGTNDRLVEIPEWIGQLLRFVLLYGIAPFFWLVTYFRLKEKQV